MCLKKLSKLKKQMLMTKKYTLLFLSLFFSFFSTGIFAQFSNTNSNELNDKIKFFLVGFLGTFFATLFLTLILYFSKEEYNYAAFSIFSVNIITMIIEGIVSMFLLLFIKKVYPKILKD